jgi:threonine/homoserine/homoserine lactone efflux protein
VPVAAAGDERRAALNCQGNAEVPVPVQELGSVFVSALGIGLSIAAPVGPIGLLVIERTLRQGFAVGLATGLGAAVADALYGAVGAYGVVLLLKGLQAAAVPLMWGGSAFLLGLAWRTWRSAGRASVAAGGGTPAGGVALGTAFVGTVLLTLANPATVLSFVAVFGSLAGGVRQGAAAAPWQVAGVFAGSALWWLLLATAVALARHRVGPRERRWVGRAAALLLAGFALWALSPVWAGTDPLV